MYKAVLYKLSIFSLFAVAAASAHADLPDFTQLVEKNAAAVVNVQATEGNAVTEDSGDGEGDDQDVPEIFRKFFGPGGAPGGHPHQGGSRLGSGFILSADGYILTNNHVVDGAEQVVVRLSDRRELDATVVGHDAQSDIALLKVKATGLPTVTLGNSDKLKPGQWVVAIGSPFGFDHSVTHGVVSYVGRGFGGPEQQYVPFIQTDVPINRGNSGGPLFNLDGQVVGINSQIASNTGSSVGISFAIPINTAINTVDALKAGGHVARGMLGVGIQKVTRETAQSLGLDRAGGALVNAVTPGSGAEKAGVQRGDVVLAYNGHEIDDAGDLPLQVGGSKPGSQAELKVYRDGKSLTLPITVGELPQDKTQLASLGKGGDGKTTNHNALGLIVEDITADQRKQLGLKDAGGVVVSSLNGAARRSPLQTGDVVLMVGRKAVKSASEFNDAVKDVKPGDSAMLLVKRGEATQFVTVSVPKTKERG